MDYTEHGKEKILKGLDDALSGCSWITAGELKVRVEKIIQDTNGKILKEMEEEAKWTLKNK